MGLDETLEGEEGDTGNSYVSGDKEDIELPGVQSETDGSNRRHRKTGSILSAGRK